MIRMIHHVRATSQNTNRFVRSDDTRNNFNQPNFEQLYSVPMQNRSRALACAFVM